MGQLLKNCCGCSAFLPIPRLLFGEGRCSSAQDVWLSTQTQGIYAAETVKYHARYRRPPVSFHFIELKDFFFQLGESLRFDNSRNENISLTILC